MLDLIKNSVLESFDGSISILEIVLGLLVALLAGLFILFVYRRTMRQVSFNRSFCISMLLITAISAMMVLTITSNLALSLGMVGALSIVRFRTAVKDPSDTAFLFWAVAAGITAGAGFYLLTVIGCLVVGLICILCVVLFDKADKPFLLIVRAENAEAANQVEAALTEGAGKFSLSSMLENDTYTEVIYELGVNPQMRETIAQLKTLPGIRSVSLVDCRKG